MELCVSTYIGDYNVVLITVGDIIRSVLPVNLIFLFAAVIVITTELRKKIRS